MKYPCSDGIDRDKDIEEYLRLKRRLEETKDYIKKLEILETQPTHRLSQIFTDKLGLVGLAAITAVEDEEGSHEPLVPA